MFFFYLKSVVPDSISGGGREELREERNIWKASPVKVAGCCISVSFVSVKLSIRV